MVMLMHLSLPFRSTWLLYRNTLPFLVFHFDGPWSFPLVIIDTFSEVISHFLLFSFIEYLRTEKDYA